MLIDTCPSPLAKLIYNTNPHKYVSHAFTLLRKVSLSYTVYPARMSKSTAVKMKLANDARTLLRGSDKRETWKQMLAPWLPSLAERLLRAAMPGVSD